MKLIIANIKRATAITIYYFLLLWFASIDSIILFWNL